MGQIKGTQAALADPHPAVLRELITSKIARHTLDSIHDGAKSAVPTLTKLLQDADPFVRSDAAVSLARLGETAQAAVPVLTKLPEDADRFDRRDAAEALRLMGHLPIISILHMLNSTGDILYMLKTTRDYADQIGVLRFWSHFFGGGDEDIELLMLWVGKPFQSPE